MLHRADAHLPQPSTYSEDTVLHFPKKKSILFCDNQVLSENLFCISLRAGVGTWRRVATLRSNSTPQQSWTFCCLLTFPGAILMSSIMCTSQSYYRLLTDAFANYANRTGIDLSNNPFANKLQYSSSPDAILELLHDREKAFKEYRDGNRKLMRLLSRTVHVLHALSGVLGESISLVSSPTSSHRHWFHTTPLGTFSTIKSHLCWYRCSSRCPCPLPVFSRIHLMCNKLGCQ